MSATAAAEPEVRESSTVRLFRALVQSCVPNDKVFRIGTWTITLAERPSAGGEHRSLHVGARGRNSETGLEHLLSCSFNMFENDGELIVSRGFVARDRLRPDCKNVTELLQELLQKTTNKSTAQLRAEAAVEPGVSDVFDSLYQSLLEHGARKPVDAEQFMHAFSSEGQARIRVYVKLLHAATPYSALRGQYFAARRELNRVHLFFVNYRDQDAAKEPKLVGTFREPSNPATLLNQIFAAVKTDWIKRQPAPVEAHVTDSALSVLAAAPDVAVLASMPAFLERMRKPKRPHITTLHHTARMSGTIAGYNYRFHLQGNVYTGTFSTAGKDPVPARITFQDNAVNVELVSPIGVGYECSREDVRLVRDSTEYSVRCAIEGAARGLAHYKEMPWECNG